MYGRSDSTPISMKKAAARTVDTVRSEDQRDDKGSKSFLNELRNFSDESDLFSDVSTLQPTLQSNTQYVPNVTPKVLSDECLDQVYQPSRKQLELLQKHNVAMNGGMLLVDPIVNEKVYLYENNHSLTDHDLFIVQDERCYDEDEFSIVSNVTEVTYGEKARNFSLVKQMSLEGIHNPISEAIQPGCGGLFHLVEPIRLLPSCVNNDPSNIKGFPTSCNDILVCITSTYIATSEEMDGDNERLITERSKHIGLRCAWHEPTMSHKLGATFIEGSDERAYVNQVIMGSHAASCGIRNGDAVSVSSLAQH